MDNDKKNKQQEVQEAKETKEESGEVTEKNRQVAQEEFDSLKDLTTKLEDQYKRAVADYQNLQRRTQEEKREWARLSNKDLLLKLLPILDTLLLAEKHTKDGNFSLAVKQFLQVLEQEGVTRIQTVGEEFNPLTMEAVATAEGENNRVIEEARSGYLFYDIILRPSQVIVGKKEEK